MTLPFWLSIVLIVSTIFAYIFIGFGIYIIATNYHIGSKIFINRNLYRQKMITKNDNLFLNVSLVGYYIIDFIISIGYGTKWEVITDLAIIAIWPLLAIIMILITPFSIMTEKRFHQRQLEQMAN